MKYYKYRKWRTCRLGLEGCYSEETHWSSLLGSYREKKADLNVTVNVQSRGNIFESHYHFHVFTCVSENLMPMLAFGNNYDPLNDNHHNNNVDMDSSINYRTPMFGRHGQSPTMAVNSSAQFPHTGNWFGSSGYYHNTHPYYHPTPIQQHQMLSIMQENAQNGADPNLISWPHNHHQHQNFEWMSQLGSQCQMSEYSADDSDISPSPTSHRTISPSYIQPIRGKSPYEWMKKTSFQSEPSPGKTRTKDKYRVVYTDQQRVELEKEFLFNKYITIRRKTEMATYLGLSERQVKIWFQNRRAKERKQTKKKQETQFKQELQYNSL